jgi:hypothetical protein
MRLLQTIKNIKMQTRILIMFLLLISATASIAQRQFDPQTLEMIKTKKIAFITEQIGLTSAEAEKFWPVYNELDKGRYQIMDKKRDLIRGIETPKPGMSEGDYRKLANEIASTQVLEGKLIEEYNIKFLNILPAQKVAKLYLAEQKFRTTLMHEFRKSQQDKTENENK